MKKFFFFASFAVLGVFASCTKESSEMPASKGQELTSGQELTFSVSNEGTVDTKTYNVSPLKFNSGDKLSVFDSKLANNLFTQVTAKADSVLDYKGEISEGSTAGYVVYPYDSTSTVTSEGILTVKIPSSYSAKNSNSVISGMNLSVGVLDEGKTVLKNVFGIVGVNIPAEAYGIRRVKLSANEPFVGTVSFKYNDGEPVVTGIADGATAVEFNVKLDSDTGRPSDGSYYFCVVPGRYTGLKLTLTLYNGKTVEFTTSNTLTVQRNSRTMLKQFKLEEVQTAPAGELVLSLDFLQNNVLYQNLSDSVVYMPTSDKNKRVLYFDQDGYSYPFFIGGKNFTSSGTTYVAGFCYLKTNKALQIHNKTCYIVTPPIPGKRLSAYRFAHANLLGKKDSQKKLVIYNAPGESGTALVTSVPQNVAISTHDENGQPTLSDWVETESDAGAPMYIYCTVATSNVCIRHLDLKYVDVE